MNRTKKVVLATAAGALAIGGLVATLNRAPASDCAQMKDEVLFDTSSNCASQPSIPRALGGTRFLWGGREWLAVNMGNEIRLWDISDPDNPTPGATSRFGVPNQGDSDYDLMAFSVCDDCRYGSAWYKMGAVVFDFGTGSRPVFADFMYTPGANGTFGGVTYEDPTLGQVLITAAYADEACPTTSTLWSIVSPSHLEHSQCVESPTRPILATGGALVENSLLICEASTRCYDFTLSPGSSPQYRSQPFRAAVGKFSGLSLDGRLLVQASNAGTGVWSLESSGWEQVSTIPGDYSQADLRDGMVFLSLGGLAESEAVYSLADPAAPQVVDQDFWNASQPWNNGHPCNTTQAGLWGGEGVLFMARYSVLQVADFGACMAPPPPPTPTPPPAGLIFSDGFESGDHATWQ